MGEYNDSRVKANGLTEREEETLPNWAQERLSDLRGKTSQLKQENNALREVSDAPNDKSAVSYGDVENDPHYLPDGTYDAVRYTFGGGHIDVRLKEVAGALELVGSEDLSFSPQATNVIRIGLNN